MSKIMIIDDDATSLAIARAFLEDEYELSLVRSGPQALGALKGPVLPDLILLDMLMPGLSGLEVLEKIKQNDRLKEIPIIFLTGERRPDMEIKGYAAGAVDFLLKPVDRLLLKIRIRQQLAYNELLRENRELKKLLNLSEEE